MLLKGSFQKKSLTFTILGGSMVNEAFWWQLDFSKVNRLSLDLLIFHSHIHSKQTLLVRLVSTDCETCWLDKTDLYLFWFYEKWSEQGSSTWTLSGLIKYNLNFFWDSFRVSVSQKAQSNLILHFLKNLDRWGWVKRFLKNVKLFNFFLEDVPKKIIIISMLLLPDKRYWYKC